MNNLNKIGLFIIVLMCLICSPAYSRTMYGITNGTGYNGMLLDVEVSMFGGQANVRINGQFQSFYRDENQNIMSDNIYYKNQNGEILMYNSSAGRASLISGDQRLDFVASNGMYNNFNSYYRGTTSIIPVPIIIGHFGHSYGGYHHNYYNTYHRERYYPQRTRVVNRTVVNNYHSSNSYTPARRSSYSSNYSRSSSYGGFGRSSSYSGFSSFRSSRSSSRSRHR